MEKHYNPFRFLRNFLCGVLIGGGAVLPGVSGGVLAVIFGVYRPFMEIFLVSPVLSPSNICASGSLRPQPLLS